MAKSNSGTTNNEIKEDDKFFKSLIKATDNPFAEIAEQGGANITGFIDTGSAALNALISGSIRGGYPRNKITGLAGDPSTGKTFFMLSAVKSFLEDNPRARAFLFDSEFNLSKDLLSSRGIDCTRTVIVPVETIEQFRTQAINILDKYLEIPKEKRWPMFMALDSLGMLSTSKEMEDMLSGKEAVDMTKARLTKGAFRALTLKLGKADVPMIVTNHTYMTIGMFASKKMGGGCLVAGTKVKTKDGYKNIEEFKIGDTVTTLFSEEKVINTFRHEDKEVYEIEFEDGSIVRCSSEHKFLVDGKWIEAYNLAELVMNTKTLNTSVDVADMTGDLDVYRQQIFQAILLDSFKSAETKDAA